MSSIEVVYQLQGLADYMLATQGTALINAWAYRQMLKKLLNQVKVVKEPKPGSGRAAAANVDYDELINKLYLLCLHNFTDFMNAGYSCDLVLCNLDPARLTPLKRTFYGIVSVLKEELDGRKT